MNAPQGPGRLEPILESSADSFGKLIADSTRNKLDLASHYPYSPERWRIFVDGSRVFPEYGPVSQYNHNVDVHELKPAAGETVVMETAERPRYVVQYELASSMALSINQALASGDTVKWGLFDGTDGWFFEHTGDQATDECTLVTLRNGTRVATNSGSIHKALTTFTRFLLLANWYNVGAQKFLQTWTEGNGIQNNDIVGRMSRDDGRGPQVGNLPLRFEVTASGSTSGLILNAGSVATVTLGNTQGITRTKVSQHTRSIGTANTWLPILAVRTDPDRVIVNTQLIDVFLAEYSTQGDVRLLASAHDPSKVLDGADAQLTDSNYSTPPEHHRYNSTLETSTDVAKAADTDGTPVASTSSPGGFQLGYGSLYTSGQGSTFAERVMTRAQKRPIFGRDTVVIWANATATGDITFELAVEQDW